MNITYYWMCDALPGKFSTVSMSEADMASMDAYPGIKAGFMDAVDKSLGFVDHKHIYEVHPATNENQKVFRCHGRS